MAKVSNPKVIAVIVTYNRKELLKECITALLNQDYRNCDILVVDNASTDGTFDYISELLKNKRVIYKNTGANLGGAGGFNFGMKEAVNLGCDFVWVMDDDCMVHTDSLTELLKVDAEMNGNYGFLASKVLWKDGNICQMNIQRRTLTKCVTDFDSHLVPVAMSSFVSMFIKSSTIKEFGLPIKEFFIWTDDWEYTRRISRKLNCYLVNSSVVTHKSNNNIGANVASDSSDRLDRYNYLYRNDMYLYRREGLRGMAYLYPRLMYHILRVLVSKCDNKFKRIKLILRATKNGRKFNPEIEFVS